MTIYDAPGAPPEGPPGGLALPHGTLALPAFMPDATFGVVRALDARDLASCGVPAIVMNTFHLMRRPGSSTIRALGGLHAMYGWERPIVTDSGGFQAFSLIRENPGNGQITDRGILFRPGSADKKILLTPEKSIQLQLRYGSDIVICLDDCTHADDPPERQAVAVERTVRWARRCRAEFDALTAGRRGEGVRPQLFAVIQGGADERLRRECAEALLAIGFDGFGFGGWPLDAEGKLLTSILALTRALVPAHFPMHALGVGRPDYVVECARMGYGLFDSALPTRDARRGRLYHFAARGSGAGGYARAAFSNLYINDDKFIKDTGPISPGCTCACCGTYSRAFLHHLFELGDPLYARLATIHNLSSMTALTASLRQGG